MNQLSYPESINLEHKLRCITEYKKSCRIPNLLTDCTSRALQRTKSVGYRSLSNLGQSVEVGYTLNSTLKFISSQMIKETTIIIIFLLEQVSMARL